MREYILEAVGQLERVNVSQSILDVWIYDEFGETQDFSAQMEGVAETRLFTLFCGQCFDWFQVEIVVQVEIVEVFTVNKQIQHVVALATYL